MPVYISLLRGVNVGGRNKIKTADLRETYSSLGLRDTRTLLQSGNAVFQSDDTHKTRLKNRIEAAIATAFGFDVQVILRTESAFRRTIARHPFTEEQLLQPGKIALVFLAHQPSDAALADLREKHRGSEVIHADGRELYIFYRDGMARSKLDSKFIERTLGTAGTARNWNTCQKLLRILADYPPCLACRT